jgi:hypothetical protein
MGYTFVSSANLTYALNTNPADWPSAEKACNAMGGHLAYYGSLAEQVSCMLRRCSRHSRL